MPASFAKAGGALPALRVTRINTGAGMVNLATDEHKDGVVVAAPKRLKGSKLRAATQAKRDAGDAVQAARDAAARAQADGAGARLSRDVSADVAALLAELDPLPEWATDALVHEDLAPQVMAPLPLEAPPRPLVNPMRPLMLLRLVMRLQRLVRLEKLRLNCRWRLKNFWLSRKRIVLF